jgi:hypothetical protein
MAELTELEAVRILHSPASGPSQRHDAEAFLTRLGWRPLAIDLAYNRDLGTVGSPKIPWHVGKHNWKTHDGYPRHAHSENGLLTIDPHDPHPHFH